jgi:Zn-dependent protease
MFNLSPAVLISRLIILAIAFTVHEFCHALIADRFGDATPRQNGRLTLNPLSHIDPMGALMLLVAGFGWAKPVPVNPYILRRQSPAAMMWVSLAGPLSNFFLAVLGAIPFRLGLVNYTASNAILPSLYQFLNQFIIINLALMLFNLIPIAPLDGEEILAYFLPPRWAQFFDKIRPYGPIILLVLVFLGPTLGIDLLNWIIGPPLIALRSLLLGLNL